jgi:hypothetical protein
MNEVILRTLANNGVEACLARENLDVTVVVFANRAYRILNEVGPSFIEAVIE